MTEVKICTHPECEKTVAAKYCGRTHANQHNAMLKAATKTEKVDLSDRIKVIRSGGIPTAMENELVKALGYDNVQLALQEMEFQETDTEYRLTELPEWLRKRKPIFPTAGPEVAFPRQSMRPTTGLDIEPHAQMMPFGESHLADIRRKTEITYDDIELMQRCGPVVLASRMKKAPLVAALSGERKWTVKSKNRKLAAVAKANAHEIFMRYIQDMLLAMDYGAAFGSMVWAKKTPDEIGVDEAGVGGSKEWWVVDKIQWAHPTSVDKIVRRKGDHSFAGFIHVRDFMKPREKLIAPPQAFVLTYGGQSNNLYGRSFYDPVYDFWFWYEVTMRSCLRFLERMGIPVTVCEAPSKGTVIRADGSEVPSAEYALLVAGYAAFHSAVFIPSDVDPVHGQPLWRLRYMDTNQKGEQFIKMLEYLTTQIARGLVVGDRAATQSTEYGSYNAAEMHDKATQIDNDMIFKDFLGQINHYWMNRYGEFNIDPRNPPPLNIQAQVLDPVEREILMRLFATAGNVKIGDGTPLDFIDWERAFQGVYAPILTEEEREAQRKKVLDDSIEKQKEFQKLQPKPEAGGFPPKSGRAAPKAPQNGKQQSVKASFEIIDHMADGGFLPVIMMPEQAAMAVGSQIDEGSINLDESRLGRGEEANDIQLGILDDLKKALKKASREISGRIGSAADKLLGDDKAKDPDFEKKHPRGEGGRFAKKAVVAPGTYLENVAESLKEYVELMGTEDFKELSAVLGQPNWPGESLEWGIKGSFEFKGTNYLITGEPSAQVVMVGILTHQRIKSRLAEMGYDGTDVISPATYVITGGVGDERLSAKGLNKTFSDLYGSAHGSLVSDTFKESMAAGGPGAFVSQYEDAKYVIMDSTLLEAGKIAEYEAVAVHEMLHARNRTGTMEGEQKQPITGMAERDKTEEAFTTFLSWEYSDKYDLPKVNGYPTYTGWYAKVFEEIGWSQKKAYDFIDSFHRINGGNYVGMREAFQSLTGMSEWATLDGIGIVTVDWVPEWREVWEGIGDAYGWSDDQRWGIYEGYDQDIQSYIDSQEE